MPELEIILRTAAALALSQLVALLLITGWERRTHRLAAVYTLSVLAFVLTSSAYTPALLGDWQPLWVFLCVIKGGVFWLLAHSLFVDGFRWRTSYAIGIAALGAYGIMQQLYLYQLVSPSALEQAVGYGFDAVVLGLVASAVYGAWRGLATDLVERRRRLRLYFIAAVGTYLALAASVQIYNQLATVKTPALLVNANLLLMTAMSLTASASLLRLRDRSWLASPHPSPAESSRVVRAPLLESIKRAMEIDKIYRVEKLSIGQLAEHLSTPEYQLRQAINEGLGHRNFNDFLHAYRIAEASEKLAQPEEGQIPVLTLAMDVGYASIGPFNRAFKARTGMTPTRYRQRNSTAT